MTGIKGIADFENRFFELAKKMGESGELLKGDIEKELESGKDFPVSLKADFSLLISEINALEETRSLLKGIVEELQYDFSSLIKSKSFDDFADNFKELVKVERLKEAPDVLRGIIHMEVGLALSFIAAMKNFETLRMKDYEGSFNQYFFSREGYKTVSGDLIIRPKLPKNIRETGDQINAERYIRDMTRIVVETTGDKLYNLRERYARFAATYQEGFKKKLIDWFDSFGDLAEASLLPVVEGIVNGAFNIELNPLVAAAIGTFCSVTTRKATEHSYLTLLVN